MKNLVKLSTLVALAVLALTSRFFCHEAQVENISDTKYFHVLGMMR